MSDTPNPASVPVADGCYMIGRRNPNSILQCNTYLRTFEHNGEKTHWCIDPGSRIDLPVVRENLLHHIGELSALSLFSVNHQDPDVVGNLRPLTAGNRRLTGIITEDAWRLVRHLNVRPRKMSFANRLPGDSLKVGGGRIQTVPTPFCHFRGAVAFYDVASRVLFTGDLFGGLNAPGRVGLFAEEEDWSGIAQFHQIYMPSRSTVRHAMAQIRALDPPVEVIAPQHGFLLKGDLMYEVMERLESIYMGMDLLPDELDEKHFDDYAGTVQGVVAAAESEMGRSEVLDVLGRLDPHSELAQCLDVHEGEVRLKRAGIRALPLLVDALFGEDRLHLRDRLKVTVLNECTERGIPLPQMGIGVEEYDESELDVIRMETDADAEPAPYPPPSVPATRTESGESHEPRKRWHWIIRFLIQEVCTLAFLGAVLVVLAYLRAPGFPHMLQTLLNLIGVETPESLRPPIE